MNRLYEPPAYGPQPGCFWTGTVKPTQWPALEGDKTTDIAIIGAGYTGLTAALHLAEAGANVTLLEAEHPGWGASGRNGGFCCLGGAAAPHKLLTRLYGPDGAADWYRTEAAAIDTVETAISRLGLSIERHSEGETMLAHSPRAWKSMLAEAQGSHDKYGAPSTLIHRDALRQHGLGGPWLGALTRPLGFALNPRKYAEGLAAAARDAGAAIFANTPVTAMTRAATGWQLHSPRGAVSAKRVILASNGYSSEDLPGWMRARTLPVQSSVIVTRPITAEEQRDAGFSSAQMCYDSRSLLHYFRLMPDGRFLFGMRGGLHASARTQRWISAKIRADFARLFPAWRAVEITHEWSGLVCMMAGLTPFVGPVPGHDGLFAGLGYHGNGVAMASHAGRILADLARGAPPAARYPQAMQAPPGRFPLGKYRRLLLRPSYLIAGAFDL